MTPDGREREAIQAPESRHTATAPLWMVKVRAIIARWSIAVASERTYRQD
jgi:hypothetical protein